jgi:hypothetical protein
MCVVWRGPIVRDGHRGFQGWSFGYVEWDGSAFDGSAGAFQGVKAGGRDHCLAAVDGQTIACVVEGASFAREAQNAILWLVAVAGARGHLSFEPANRPHAALPYSIRGTPRAPVSGHAADHFLWPLAGNRGQENYRQPFLCIDHVTGRWYMVGVEDHRGSAGELWFTYSDDKGITWEERRLFAEGSRPSLVKSANGELLLLFTQSGKYGYQGVWPDDAPEPPPQDQYDWPGMGPLGLLRSRDGGRTWGDPEVVVASDSVINGRCTVAPDGRLWLVYVEGPQIGTTALYLTSSADNGKTWATPVQISDGTRYLDREPDIAVWDDQVLVAFARSGLGLAGENVWVAKMPVN